MLTSLFSLFYVTGEFHRFLHRGRAKIFNTITDYDSVGSENRSTLNKDLKSDLSGLDTNYQFHIDKLVAALRHCVLL